MNGSPRCPSLSRSLASALGLALALAPLASASARGPVEDAASRFAPAPPAPSPAPDPDGEALRLVDPTPVSNPAPEPITLAAPAPVVDGSEVSDPVPRLTLADGRRPKSGNGLLALGGLMMAGSSILVLTALAGPGWLDLSRDQALLMGGAAVPFAAVGAGMVVGGAKASRRLHEWSDRNGLHPPKSGNGMLVVGGAVTLGFAGLAAFSAQQAVTKPTRERGDWAPTIVAGGAMTVGVMVLAGGALRRSKFAEWERVGYVLPGPMALRRGGGVGISGRF